MTQQPTHVRAGFCAILGLPNVGKSTLLNRALGKKLVAVSPKPQTTRNRIHGVVNLSDAQIAFVDTPGLQSGQTALRRYMREEARGAVGDCDVALLVIDASRKRGGAASALQLDAAVAESLAVVTVPVVVALNKIDRLPDKKQLLPLIAAVDETGRFEAIVPISARRGIGVEALVEQVAQRLPVGPRLFPEDMYTDRAEHFLAAELVREQLFLQLGDELPYAAAVVVERFEERSIRGDIVIDAVVYVERDSQKGIVVGKGGARIREVGLRARAQIGDLFCCPVHLKLHVKVDPQWSQGISGIRRMGYE